MGAVGGTNEVAAPAWGGLIIDSLCRFLDCFGGRQLVQIGDGAFGMGGGLHDGAGVVLQHLNPACDIAGMIGARLDAKPKIGGKESCAKLGDQFLPGIAFIAPFLAAKVAIKAALMPSPMHGFMTPGGVIAVGIMEGREGR